MLSAQSFHCAHAWLIKMLIFTDVAMSIVTICLKKIPTGLQPGPD